VVGNDGGECLVAFAAVSVCWITARNPASLWPKTSELFNLRHPTEPAPSPIRSAAFCCLKDLTDLPDG